MSDIYKAREDDLRKCDEIFKSVPNQVVSLPSLTAAPPVWTWSPSPLPTPNSTPN